MIAWEKEAVLTLQEFGADKYEIVVPSVSILAEPPVSLVDGNVDARKTRKAAQAYLDIANDRKNTLDDIFAVINDKDYAFTLSPEKVFKTAVFMGKVGTVKDPPARWQDLFFPDIHDLPGD